MVAGVSTWVSIRDLSQSGKYISESKEGLSEIGIHNLNSKVVPKNTVLFSFKLSVGKVASTNKELYTNEAIAALVMKDHEKLDTNYLYHVMKSFDFFGFGSKAVMGNTLNKAKLKKIKIPLPPLSEQRAIAARLDAADRLRRLDAELVAKYDELKRSLFLEMFGDLRVNSQNFDMEKLESVTSKIGDGLHGTPKYSDSDDYFFINGTNFRNGEIQLTDKTKTISEDEYLKLLKPLDDNTILLSINGTIGNVALYRNESVSLGKSVCYINVVPSEVNKYFLAELLKTDHFMQHALKYATGSTITNVGLKAIRNLPVPINCRKLQEEFVRKLRTLNHQQSLARAAAVRSEELFLGVLGEVFG